MMYNEIEDPQQPQEADSIVPEESEREELERELINCCVYFESCSKPKKSSMLY